MKIYERKVSNPIGYVQFLLGRNSPCDLLDCESQHLRCGSTHMGTRPHTAS